ncbi:ring-1,2-phenylacetyl-CoA epoxidase subunit PaaD [Lishizhenia tianjinensis]|uniref:Ring-1,2-phenylacetyl-CoA epoxidase subunit PaaD n=1 Tax=Lishizhenia tianjinensis TaxID=477690 RepID=A0A1I7ADK1_9FLAO|nr:1,2-phenylacetyl-CoA epoxidase subunit PaaD [Lishizhenia tianjinensis]SFT73021.1 ring-1,2-phenylacetyl-CoA epoxidase subunit PaaD [Lishizhenia tianjinensis]
MTITKEYIWELLEHVSDPEVPVLTIVDLGVVRGVEVKGEEVSVTITPTYSGCPAMQVIEEDIRETLKNEGLEKVTVQTVLSPAWTTDWLTENGRRKLKEYGIAPPQDEVDKSVLFSDPVVVPCPKCDSKNTKMVSQFGSTACKAHYQCLDCQEPFDYFKCLR